MRKFISAVTSLAMAASMATAFVPVTSIAEDSTKGFAIKAYAEADSKYASMGSNVTVSAADIAAGDVLIPCGLYLDEATADTQALSVQFTVKGGAAAGDITFKEYGANDDYFATAKDFTWKDGTAFTSKKAVLWGGSWSTRNKKYTPAGMYSITCVKGMKAADTENYYWGCTWMNNGSTYEHTGDSATAHPFAVFDVTLPKGLAAGEYTIDFLTYNTATIPGVNNPATMIETNERFTPGDKLTLQEMTIKVEGSGSSDDTTTTTATTTKKVDTTTTTKKDDPVPSDALVVDFGNYTANAGDEVYVDLYINKDVQIAGVDCNLSYDSALEFIGFEASSPALEESAVAGDIGHNSFNFTSIKGGSGDPMTADSSLALVQLTFKVKAGTPDGVYKIGFGDKSVIIPENKGTPYNVVAKNGNITVGKGGTVDDTTTTTKATTTSKKDDPTTTTTTKAIPSDALVVDFGNYTANAGEEVYVDLMINKDVQIAGVDCNLSYDSALEFIGFEASSPALEESAVAGDIGHNSFNFTSIKGGSGDPMTADSSLALVQLTFKVKAGTPDGVYKIGFGDKSVIIPENKGTPYNVVAINGNITVGKGSTVDDTTTTSTTTKATTTTTSTTTKNEDPTTTTTTTSQNPVDDKYTPVWGDTNCDGEVNVADVVVLNKWLNDHSKYDLKDQGAVNADCCDPQDANGGAVSAAKAKEGLSAADSSAIIRSIVKLIDLPTTSK